MFPSIRRRLINETMSFKVILVDGSPMPFKLLVDDAMSFQLIMMVRLRPLEIGRAHV